MRVPSSFARLRRSHTQTPKHRATHGLVDSSAAAATRAGDHAFLPTRKERDSKKAAQKGFGVGKTELQDCEARAEHPSAPARRPLHQAASCSTKLLHHLTRPYRARGFRRRAATELGTSRTFCDMDSGVLKRRVHACLVPVLLPGCRARRRCSRASHDSSEPYTSLSADDNQHSPWGPRVQLCVSHACYDFASTFVWSRIAL